MKRKISIKPTEGEQGEFFRTSVGGYHDFSFLGGHRVKKKVGKIKNSPPILESGKKPRKQVSPSYARFYLGREGGE